MKKIPLNKGKFVLVDTEDYAWLSQWKWHVSDSGYARRNQYVPSTYKGAKDHHTVIVWMHRELNKTPQGLFTDHINQDRLDNRKLNLRTVDKSQNAFNCGRSKRNSSGCRGVWWDEWSKTWRAELKLRGKKISLGRFTAIKDAIKARAQGEQKYAEI